MRWPLLAAGAVLLAVLLAVLPWLWLRWIDERYAAAMHVPDDIAASRVALVLGARVYADGRLSSMLRDRVDTAVDLYKSGKVQKLLMSGDNSQLDYNEPDAMKAYAVARGVPAADIQPDYGGRRTYDSCYRARAIFQVTEAVIVSQAFHLPRALFLCEQLGVKSTGAVADRQRYSPRSIAWSEIREIPATFFAFLDVIRRAPPPVMGSPIPID